MSVALASHNLHKRLVCWGSPLNCQLLKKLETKSLVLVINSDGTSAESDIESIEKNVKEQNVVTNDDLDLPDKTEFPLMHSLFSLNPGKTLYD